VFTASFFGLHILFAYSEMPTSYPSPFGPSLWFVSTTLAQPELIHHSETNIRESYTSSRTTLA